MRPDDGHVGILPDIAGCLSPLSEEQHSVPLEGRVGGGCEVQVTLTDLNRQTLQFSINKQQTNLLPDICQKILLMFLESL